MRDRTPAAPEHIPQADPHAGYLAQRPEIDAAIARVLLSGRYVLGDEVEAFEAEFSAFVGSDHGIGVASGTDALALGLKALGVGRGDGVATVSHTAVATVAAIERAGATPVLVDVDRASQTMAPEALAAVLARPPLPIRAVISVHLYGHPADMGAICALAARHGAAVLEDGAQAHGAAIDGRRVGSFGQLGAFSFYPTKNLAGFGDGGMLVTDDPGLAKRLRRLRQYGWDAARSSRVPGENSRLDELQAAVLRVRLLRLEADNGRRRAIAEAYDRGLDELPLVRPARRPGVLHAFHQYVVRVADRPAVRARMERMKVATAIHYPAPVHLQPAYLGRLPIGPAGLAVTEALADEVLSLPMFPQLTDQMAARVVEALRAAAPVRGAAAEPA